MRTEGQDHAPPAGTAAAPLSVWISNGTGVPRGLHIARFEPKILGTDADRAKRRDEHLTWADPARLCYVVSGVVSRMLAITSRIA